ncbi:hypothetical protein F2Q69_00041797 [Brassica cretica]|uniref:Uncharacterized protein n=1 Tax=Brassica cretica TaxID=69181 RepID=A0A8S9NH32_BRACR|nr:hypothetical protein F2Q69_00041797 [Brassica cretica]
MTLPLGDKHEKGSLTQCTEHNIGQPSAYIIGRQITLSLLNHEPVPSDPGICVINLSI